MEFVPLIRAGNGTSKMNNFLFHPGALFGLGKGFTLATRAAFETSGRYGFTPVLNKIVKKRVHTSSLSKKEIINNVLLFTKNKNLQKISTK